MRKTIAAVSVGLLLVAGQAAAAGSNAVSARVGDRVGASSDGENFAIGPIIPVIIFIASAVALGSIVSDEPGSDA